MTCIAWFVVALDYLQNAYPRFVSTVNWVNPLFTGFTLFNLDLDLTLKVLAFLFVTLPLGIIQWANLVKFLKERRDKQNDK